MPVYNSSMGGKWILVGVLGLAFMGCQTGNQMDLGSNSSLYRSPGYVSKLPGDRSVFVAPVKDERSAADLPRSEGAYPIRYMSDAVWERSVAEMVYDILVEELEGSRVFRSVLTQARGDALVLVPSLVQLYGGQQELVEGARSLAETAIRVQVHGPADEAGNRMLILDETFTNRQGSATSFRPPSVATLTGVSLRITMGKLVSGLDQSNVARTGVPLEAIGQVIREPGK